MKLKKTGDSGDGFTLVELITVLVIVTVLAAVAVPSLAGFIEKAKQEKYIMEAQGVRQSIELYLMEHYDEEIDAMVLLAKLTSKKLCSSNHMLSGYMMVTCTKGAYIEGLTVDTKARTIVGLKYRVEEYRIEIDASTVTVTRPGKGRSYDTRSSSLELDDGASSVY